MLYEVITLTEGLEWNIKVTEKESFDIVKMFTVTFESYWNDSNFESFDPNDESCRTKLNSELAKIYDFEQNKFHLQCSIKPYPYQQEIFRITSYNVCYTKLLRDDEGREESDLVRFLIERKALNYGEYCNLYEIIKGR